MFELGDEHRRHAVETRAALLGAGPQRRLRLECLRGVDHRRAVVGRAEVAHHHPEAVIERHRQADPVGLGVVEQAGDEMGVIEDVVVGERRALGESGRAARVLDVDRVVEVEAGGSVRERVGVDGMRREL